MKTNSGLKQIGGTHYEYLRIEPVELINEYNMDWFQGEILKYCTRFPLKGRLQDLKKAEQVANMARDYGRFTFNNPVLNEVLVEEFVKELGKLHHYFASDNTPNILRELIYYLLAKRYLKVIYLIKNLQDEEYYKGEGKQ